MPLQHLLREVTQPPALTPTNTVMDAVRNMIDFDTGAIAVLDDNQRVIGIFTKKDLLGKVTALDRRPRSTPLGDAMSTQVITGRDTLAISECIRKMSEYRVRHLPIVDADGCYCGMLALCDLLRDRILEMTQDIRTLEAYFNDAPGG